MDNKTNRLIQIQQKAINLAIARGKPQRIMNHWGDYKIVEATPNFSGMSCGIAFPDGRLEWG